MTWNIRSAFPRGHRDITPDDDIDLDRDMLVMAISDGDVEIVDKYMTSVTYTVSAGWISPIIARRVGEATTATVVGLY